MAIPQTADEARAQDDAFSKQWDAEQEAKKAQEAAPVPEQQHPLTAFANWATSLPGKVSTSILDTALHGAAALVNTSADVVGKVSPTAARVERDVASGIAQVPLNAAESVRAPLAAAARQLPGGTPQEADPMEPVFAHAHAAMQDFTDAVKVKDPGLIDNATQFLAQTVPVYLAASKGVADLGWRAKNVIAGAISDYSLPPGTPRLADTLSLLRQTDNKYIAALQAADPTGGTLVNGYINFLMHKGPESDAEAHFKNMLDGVIPNFVGGEALHAIGVTLKQGNRVVRAAVNNGIGSLGDLGPPAGSRAAQRGGPAAAARAPLQQGADPAERIIEEQAARDADAAANAPAGAKRPPLIQGRDPADAIYDVQARQDAEAAAAKVGGKIVYHGTASKFDEFSDDAIGTGEGNQAFGHGHYFAENPDTANTYKQMIVNRNGLTGAVMADAQKAVKQSGGRAQAYATLSQAAANEKDPNARLRLQQTMQMVRSGNYDRGSGTLMHVEIPGEHVENMMHWDKPLSAQPKLKSVFEGLKVDVVPEGENYRLTLNGKPAGLFADGPVARGTAKQLSRLALGEDANGGTVYDRLVDAFGGNQKAASEFLSRRGIPGIKYLDQGSRAAGEGTHNLVVFNPKHAKIVKKE